MDTPFHEPVSNEEYLAILLESFATIAFGYGMFGVFDCTPSLPEDFDTICTMLENHLRDAYGINIELDREIA